MSSRGKRILWHVSAHGWGHAARQRELIKALKSPHMHITLVSSVPDWFWSETPVDGIVPGSLSPVAVEKNGVPDRELTAANLLKFLGLEKELLSEEIRLQREISADLVITDIDPLPVKAAGINSIPSIGIGNFTWDWILKEMCPGLYDGTGRIAEMYSPGTFLRLPMGPDYSPFRTTMDIPLLRGGPPGDAERVKKIFPDNGLKCLVAFRNLPEGFPKEAPKGMTVFTALPEPQNPHWLNISHGELARNEASFADLVAAADVVITKPGYGIVSQILAMGKRAVLVPGGVFPEEEYLLNFAEASGGVLVIRECNTGNVFKAALKITGEPAPRGVPAPGEMHIVKYLTKMLYS